MSKSPDAFRTISEVADDLDLPQHVLRFWETRFNQIKPMKRGGGRRYYRPDDVELLKVIKSYLYDEGYTIRGVQRLLKEQGAKKVELEAPEEIPEMVLGSTSNAPSNPDQIAAKEAVKVTDYSSAPSVTKPISGFIDKISSLGSAVASEKSKSKMAEGDLSLLSGTLQDLLECKRLLDQTRQD